MLAQQHPAIPACSLLTRAGDRWAWMVLCVPGQVMGFPRVSVPSYMGQRWGGGRWWAWSWDLGSMLQGTKLSDLTPSHSYPENSTVSILQTSKLSFHKTPLIAQLTGYVRTQWVGLSSYALNDCMKPKAAGSLLCTKCQEQWPVCLAVLHKW